MGNRQPGSFDHRNIVAVLEQRIDAVIGPLVPEGSRCALLDFPNHSNVGDSAIWLGEWQWLRRRRADLVYMCDTVSYQQQILADRIGDGIILLHGGGNLGDFWMEHQKFREMVIEEFPHNRIVQLPQTIYFQDEWCVGEAARVFGGHGNLTVLCRDQGSLDFASRRFKCPSALSPDMAFALGAMERQAAPQQEILWLARGDAESKNLALPQAGDVHRVDWLEEPATKSIKRHQKLVAQLWNKPADLSAIADALMETCLLLAEERVRRGLELLSRGKVVVTDRLHGCILCLLLGIPHVVLDNVYGKIRAFREAFLRDSALTYVAETPQDALAMARVIVNPRDHEDGTL